MKNVAYYIISDGIGGAEQLVHQTLSVFSNNKAFFLITNTEMSEFFGQVFPKERTLDIGGIYIQQNKKFRFIKYLINNRFYNIKKALLRVKRKRISNFCLNNEIKIIHAHLDFALSSSIELKRIIKVKVIYTVHGTIGIENNSFKPDIKFNQNAIDKIDCTVFVAKHLRDVFTRANLHVKIYKVIYNGIVQNLDVQQKIDPVKTQFRILYVGGCKFVKGYDVLVDTVELLVKRGLTEIQVELLGPMHTSCELKQIIDQRGITKYFHFVGFIIPPAHISFFQNCDVLFMPSRSEALPMAAIEAVFNNLPVIASKVGGLPEVISDGKNGFLNELDCNQFANNLETLIMLKKQGKRMDITEYNDQIKGKFDLNNIKVELIQLYTSMS